MQGQMPFHAERSPVAGLGYDAQEMRFIEVFRIRQFCSRFISGPDPSALRQLT
jgi:hypothetical protein